MPRRRARPAKPGRHKFLLKMEAIMPKLILVTRDGEEREMDGATGLSVMEVIRDNGVDELLALCGGCLSCATCHVHIDPRRSEEHTSELQSLMRISYAVFCLKKKTSHTHRQQLVHNLHTRILHRKTI